MRLAALLLELLTAGPSKRPLHALLLLGVISTPAWGQTVNYRSIGTNSGVLYSAGNASVSSGSSTVTFGGAASLPTNVGQGDQLVIGAETLYILSRDSATQVTTQTNATNNHTSAAYTIRRAYNTLQAWADARTGNLVGETRREVGVCYNDGAFTDGLDLNGATTDSTHYMHLTVAEGHRHNGTAGTGVVLDASAMTHTVLEIQDPYTRIEWLEIKNFLAGREGLFFDGKPANDAADNSTASNLILHNFDSGNMDAAITLECVNAVVRNCVVYDGTVMGILVDDGTATIENCTVYGITGSGGTGDGVRQGNNCNITVRNTISVGSNDDDFDLNATVDYFDYNMYGTTEGFTTGTNDQSPPADLNDLFISTTAGSENLHLEAQGHTALGTGLDLSADFTDDIDGETRTVPWDLGADMYSSSFVVNYRSIGTNAGTLYSTGNASVTSGSSTVTFAGGASLPGNVGQGDELAMGGDTFYILSRDSATQVTIQGTSGNTHTNVAYTIKRAFNSPQAWEDARQGNLVADNRREVGVGYNDGAFNSLLYIQGSTTDATHYLHLTVANGHRHNGIAGNGVRIDAGGGLGNVGIRVLDDYTIIDGWEITGVLDGYTSANATSGPYTRFENLLIHDFSWRAIHCNEVGLVVRNCIIYDGPTANAGLRLFGGDTVVENCTIYGVGGPAVHQLAGNTAEIRNVIAVGNVGDDFDCIGTLNYFGNNMYESVTGFNPASYQGGNQTPPANLEDLFVSITPGSENLHLEYMGHDALENGLDLSADFTNDIDGSTRPVPWDIGADQSPYTINYRSIGTNAATLYSSGNASINAGERIVTFASATLPTNIGQGDELVVGGETLHIYSRDSATQVTVQGAAASTHTNAAYTIKRVYNTLNAWELATQINHFTTLTTSVGVAYNDGPFSETLRIRNGLTIDKRHRKLTVAEGQRHNGVPGSGVRIDAGGGLGNILIRVEEQSFQLEWFELEGVNDGFYVVSLLSSSDNATLQNLLIHDYDGGGGGRAINIERPGTTVRNCMIWDGDRHGIWVNGTASATIENCTVYGLPYVGIHLSAGGSLTARNNISVNNGVSTWGSDFDLQGTIDYFGYNMYAETLNFDPDTCGNCAGNNQAPPADPEDLFVSITPGSEDLHLEDSEHLAMRTALDLSSSFTVDIDGQTRLAPWDLGADWNPIALNYRSIGTAVGTIYSIGNATISAGSTTVNFGGLADLPTNIGVGDELVIGAETLYILNRVSSTQVTVQSPAASTHSSEAYTIARVYNTLQAWEDDRGGDLVTEDRREIGVCYNDGWFTNRLVISGSTVDAGHYMHLTVAAGQRHDGVRNAGAGIDGGGGFGNLDAITVEDEYTRIEYLEIKDIFDSGDGVFFDDSPAANNGLVNGIFVHGFWQNNNAGVRTATPNTTIRNSIFTGGTSSGITVMTGCTMATIENCTIYGSPLSGKGVSDQPGTTVSIKNTISVNHPAGDDFVIWSGLAYFGNNMFGSVTGFDPDVQDGGNQLPPSDFSRLFVTPDQDFRLEIRGHRAGNTGLDLSADFTTDVAGDTRSGVWEIGADDGVPGTEPLDPVVVRWQEIKPN